MYQTEVLVIGCGIAGAATALRLAQNPNRQIMVLTRASEPCESNTRRAQGGIISRSPGDDAESLVTDILRAGAGASSPQAAHILAEEGPSLLQSQLVGVAKVPFDRGPDGQLLWGKEAAHSCRRILHVGDGTGQAIISGLTAALSGYPNVKIVTDATAVDLITFPRYSSDPLATYRPITCHGAYVYDRRDRTVHRYLAAATVLATGGLGRIYRNTTNPVGARGDGLAMAHRAGARIANCEYVQFHPTALTAPGAEGFLISEALRGEGGVLLSPDGRAFMADYAPEWKDLAPRDVVARAVHHEMQTHGYQHVLLDISSAMSASAIRARFPNIYATCLKAGIDITCEPIPVAPAAHYFCGGVLVDEWGRSSVGNLYAVGEVSCTGLHGANRLASTSLLEGLVWGDRAAQYIADSFGRSTAPGLPSPLDVAPWEEGGRVVEADPAQIQRHMQAIQNIMWDYVGVVRSADSLAHAIRELRSLWNDIEASYQTTRLSDDLIGLCNAVQAAWLVALAARRNRHSRGCHYREDATPAA